MFLKYKKCVNIKLENKDESKIDVKYFFFISIYNYYSVIKIYLFYVVLFFKVEVNDKFWRRCNYLCLLGLVDCFYLIEIIFSIMCFFCNILVMGCIFLVFVVCFVILSIYGFCFFLFG